MHKQTLNATTHKTKMTYTNRDKWEKRIREAKLGKLRPLYEQIGQSYKKKNKKRSCFFRQQLIGSWKTYQWHPEIEVDAIQWYNVLNLSIDRRIEWVALYWL